MFRRLTDFGYQRSLVEAVGFYLVYLILGIVVAAMLGAVAGLLAGPISGGSSFEGGLLVGSIFAVVACPVMAFGILYKKGLLRHFGFILVALLSVAGAAAGGLILGLIFVAFLTSRRGISSPEPVEVGPAFA
jgi:hypothetical protein